MTVQDEIKILFPMMSSSFKNKEITFSINNMKCRTLCIVYFKLHCYDMEDTEILISNDAYYLSKRWIVDSDWSTYYETFTIDDTVFERLKSIQIELRFILVDSDNPCVFNGLMLQDTVYQGYHAPSEANEVSEVGFATNTYVNVYSDDEEDYLQIIRPSRKSFEIHTLSSNDETVLAPHLVGETEHDKPANLFIEYIKQKEQKTTINPI